VLTKKYEEIKSQTPNHERDNLQSLMPIEIHKLSFIGSIESCNKKPEITQVSNDESQENYFDIVRKINAIGNIDFLTPYLNSRDITTFWRVSKGWQGVFGKSRDQLKDYARIWLNF